MFTDSLILGLIVLAIAFFCTRKPRSRARQWVSGGQGMGFKQCNPDWFSQYCGSRR
jgi:hypothetical protein